ncbi:TonB-dependent receptor [Xanthomonas sp. NCPPB 1638]|uniref:TonB-dependent receptor n=1 Tax=Xanthomonas TaxID=338 RepID=UPI00132EC02B|nr:TonB-dependent receptor [Xanthomonas cucurbitae]QHG85874.1 TonB-dependent receptor [Xanthomonas cucurbitae]WDM75777.1 TonB-dependent receptor [Xanthomonas cucurbitae]
MSCVPLILHPGRLALAIASLLLHPAAAFAQERATPTTLDTIRVVDASVGTLADTSTTGSALALSVLDTPASLTVIARAQLSARGDANLNDAIRRAGAISPMPHPGNGLSALSSRGFTDSASVMRLYDGIRQYGGVGVTFPFDTWSIERIEVLRGPASVIYGDGAIGGVVNIVPKRPHLGTIENTLQATVGSQDTARLGVGSGGGLSPTLAYRLDVSGNYSSGWVDRGYNGNATLSAALLWQARPDLQLTLTHAEGDQRPMRYFGTPLIDGRQRAALRRKNYNVSDSLIRFRDRWSQLDAVWTPSEAVEWRTRLYQVDSRREWRNAEGYVYNPASGLIDRSDNTQITHRQDQTGLTSTLRLRSAIGGMANTLAVGLDANRAHFKHINNTYSGSSGPVDPLRPVPGLFVSDAPTLPRYRNNAEQSALFVEDRLALTERWSVLAGLRHDRATIQRNDLLIGQKTFSKTYSNTGWRVGSVFAVQPGASFYAQFSQASDPVSGLLMLSPGNAAFDLSRGRQVEVGFKQGFDRGEWTLAAYRIRKTGLLSRDPLDPARQRQIGAQTSKGLEAALNWAFTPAWSLDLNATVLKAEFADFLETTGTPAMAVSRDGNVPPNVAERLANAWVSWEFAPRWSAGTGVRYVGKRYADNANRLELPGYSSTDVSLTWQARPATRLTARVFNVFDKVFYETAYYTDTQWFLGADRRVEFTVDHRF